MPTIASRILLILALTLCLAVTTLVAEEPQTARADEDIDRCDSLPTLWYCQFDRQGFVSFSWIRDNDQLQGIQVGYGIRGQSDEWPGWGAISLSSLRHHDERSTGVRGELVPWPFARFWGGVGPLLAIGLEDRTGTSHPGFGGYLGLGIQVTMWTTAHWQFATGAEYDLGISSESRLQAHFAVAFAHERLTIGPLHN
jgi:hypothetical protein